MWLGSKASASPIAAQPLITSGSVECHAKKIDKVLIDRARETHEASEVVGAQLRASRDVETIVKAYLGEMKATARQTSPASKHSGRAAKDSAELLDEPANKEFQRVAAIALFYLAGDRLEIQQAVGAIMRGMANPTQHPCYMLCRLASFLNAHPRFCLVYAYQDSPTRVHAEVDSDLGGDPVSRRSTDGGYEFFGTAVLDGWSCLQHTVASREARRSSTPSATAPPARCGPATC